MFCLESTTKRRTRYLKKSPDRQASGMRIQFEIKESMSEIIEEILHSDKWKTLEKDMNGILRRVVLKDLYYDSEALVDIWEQEIHITTAWSNYSYRIYLRDNIVWCEYIGAYRGLLEQNLLPKLTPRENFLCSEVLSSSLIRKEKESLLNYSLENARHKASREDLSPEQHDKPSHVHPHPKVVYDEFIKIGVPLPPPVKK